MMECFLCNSLVDKPNFRAKREDIKKFTVEILKQCKLFLKSRQHHNHKYKDVMLPHSHDDEFIGYHSSCYKEFIVKKKYLVTENVLASSTSSNLALQIDETLSTSHSTFTSTVTAGSSRCSESSQQTPMDVDEECATVTTDSQYTADDAEDDSNNFLDDCSIESFSTEDNAEECFFCNKRTIKRSSRKIFCRRIKNKDTFLLKLKQYATELNDLKMLQIIENSLKNDTQLCYHCSCNLEYFSKYQRFMKKPDTDEWTTTRDFNKIARDQLLQYINEEVILNLKVLSMKVVEKFYVEFLQDLYDLHQAHCSNMFTTHTIKSFILKKLKNKIMLVKISNHPYIMSASIDIESVDDEEIQEIIFSQEATLFALKYRSRILQIQKRNLPDYVDSDAFSNGECDIPKWLTGFWKTALGGVRMKYRQSDRLQRVASTFSQDSIFSIHQGRIKPSKHILLGLAMKSITGSKTVIDILNRQAYCISYTNILELESAAAYSCTAKKQYCPSGILPTSSLCSGVAWNNFDRFVETSSGKDTLHDTVGIIFQDIPLTHELHALNINESEDQEIMSLNVRDKYGRKRRTYEPHDLDILTSAKQACPRLADTGESTEDFIIISANSGIIAKIERLYFSWILSHKLQIENTPMWTGFNAKIFEDNSRVQKIEYLIQINDSPTDPAVVKETMRRSLAIASECGKKYYNVTYDLAIAKIALRIQAAEEEFQSLFVQFGSFHIMLSFFKAVGKFIDGSGLTNMLTDAEILARGSLNSFISGKHFNRCRKIHTLLSLAIEVLHLNEFLETQDYDVDNMKLYLQNLNSRTDENLQISDEQFNTFCQNYIHYKKETLEGKHGKTPQIFLMYTQLINYYFIMDYSIRVSDIALYMHSLEKMTNIFFAMNHQNYARYLTLYYNRIANIEKTHPGLLQDSKETFLGIRRTTKPYSRMPVDITLEQTINADAASRTTGIINITNSFASREKWSITHSIRTSVISKLMDLLNLCSLDDTSKDLKTASIVKSKKYLDDLISIITQCTNPFSSDLSENKLYNISSGQSVSNEIYNFLSSIEIVGNEQRLRFNSESLSDPERFDRPIARNKIVNFASNVTKKVKINNKVQEVAIQRDIFGRLLYAALEKKIDIKRILSYPLTPVSFSLCHADGSICKTSKSVIVKELKKYQLLDIDAPSPNITIYDGFYLLHTLKRLPEKYASISKYVLKYLLFEKKEVHIIFDKYNSPSIKDYEHDMRDEDNETQYDIHRENKRPMEFGKLLRSRNFKEKFVEFLIEDWASDEYKDLCDGKIMKLNYDHCYVYEVTNNKMMRSIDYNLSCSHEEADTKIVHHICQLNTNYRVTVRCTDSDIPIIMLSNMKYLKSEVEIMIDMGSGKDKKKVINVNEIYRNIGEQLARALTVCHIFTGNDFNPSFFKKGKKRPFDIMKREEKFQEAFNSLVEMSPLQIDPLHHIFMIIEEYVCRIYSLKSNDVNEGRLELFDKAFSNKSTGEEIFKQLRGFDAANLPPTKEELLQQIKRTIYLSNIWLNAHVRSPTNLNPEECGWTVINGRYHHYWYDGPQSPSFEEIASNIEDSNNGDDDDDDDDMMQYEGYEYDSTSSGDESEEN